MIADGLSVAIDVDEIEDGIEAALPADELRPDPGSIHGLERDPERNESDERLPADPGKEADAEKGEHERGQADLDEVDRLARPGGN